MKQIIKYDMHYTFRDNTYNAYGIAYGTATIPKFISMILIHAWNRLTRNPTMYEPYIPTDTFEGWPERYIGKELTVKVTKFKITGVKL